VTAAARGFAVVGRRRGAPAQDLAGDMPARWSLGQVDRKFYHPHSKINEPFLQFIGSFWGSFTTALPVYRDNGENSWIGLSLHV
jgi:hypothetical protein